MKHYLSLLLFPALAIGCVLFAPKDWKKTPETISTTRAELRAAVDKIERDAAEIDTAINTQRSLLDMQEKAITWQSSQIDYLNRKYGSKPPIR